MNQRFQKSLNAPLYHQVAASLRRRIEQSLWLPGEKIPSIEDLQREFEVARVTIRQAVDLLEKEGLLDRQQGRGTFVANDATNRRWLSVATSWQSQLDTIRDVTPRFLDILAPSPPPHLIDGDARLAPAYVFLKSVQSRNDDPYAIVGLHLERSIYERDKHAFNTRPAMAVLVELPGVTVKRAKQTLLIGRADNEAAGLLQMPPGSPTLETRWVITNEDNDAIYVADIVYRGDLVRFELELPRYKPQTAKKQKLKAR